jgi:NAD(P)-dependent dehydrogenase (short-subunit alcohol dehydrogenase family)
MSSLLPGKTVAAGGSLFGRRAIVIGASQGLGREIARHFLAASADVAICARTAADLETTAAELGRDFPGRRIVSAVCDIALPAEVDILFDRALDALGDIDIVVNNAGVHGPIGPIDDIAWDAWVAALVINLAGPAYSCRRAVRHFKSRRRINGRDKIVNLSGGGATSPQPGLTAYGASKAGLVRFTETLATEVRDLSIDVNAVAPGALATRLLRELQEAGPARIGADYHRRVEELLEEGSMPMARAAELCVYLASQASDGITGRLISAAWDPWPFTADVAANLAASDVYTLRRITARDRGFDWGDK